MQCFLPFIQINNTTILNNNYQTSCGIFHSKRITIILRILNNNRSRIISKLIISCILLCNIQTTARDFKVNGKILDKLKGNGICYAIVKVANTTKATITNSDGDFEILLSSKNNILICTCIGYYSDTVLIENNSANKSVSIYLTPAPALYKVFSATIKKYSASDLMIKVLDSIKTMFSNLKNYEFIAHNRYIVKENNGVGIGTGSIKIDNGIFKESFDLVSNVWETKPMRINGINEYVSRGYYNSPFSFSEVIQAQKPRVSLPSSLNQLMGTRKIQNLCGEELICYDRSFPGPLSSGALDYYKYFYEDTLMMDNQKIFKIYCEPVDKNDPGLIGYLYIDENSNNILKIEADLNQSANAGNTFEKVSFIQQYIPYNNRLNLPLDYKMFAASNYIGIIKTEYELSSLLGNYKINTNNENYNAINSVATVLPDTAKQDSLLKTNPEYVPLTREEATAYERIDSIKSLPRGFLYDASRVISSQYQVSSNFYISGPLNIYQFNHVEGHTISFSGSGNYLFSNTTDARLTISNGFSDKRFKASLSTAYYPFDDRSVMLSANVYNKLAVLFSSSNIYSPFTSTIYSLFSTRDIRNFYYTNGFDLGISGEVFSFMRLNIAYSNHVDHSATTNTTFSLLGTRQRNFNTNSSSAFPDSVNSPIYDTRLNTLSFGVNFDFREDVLENNLKRKVSNGHSFLSFGAGVLISNPKYLGSDMDFISYSGNILAELNTIKTSSLSVEINAIYSNGPVPLQMQYALPGNISGTGRNLTFRTIGVGNMFGDQALTLNVEYNFRKEIYRVLPVSVLQNLSLNTFFNAAWKNMSGKSAAFMPISYTVFTRPLLETGFSVGYLSLPVSLELAWRLTHIDRGSLRVGINTSIL